jgi:hypothetical protein
MYCKAEEEGMSEVEYYKGGCGFNGAIDTAIDRMKSKRV